MSKVESLGTSYLARLDAITTDSEGEELFAEIGRLDQREEVYAALARRGDFNASEWVIETAPRILGLAATPILLNLVKSRDSDIRTDALRALVDLDIDTARTLLPGIRRRLRSKDFWEPTEAMWALAAMHDVDSIRLIEEAAATYAANSWQPRVAAIVVGILRGEVKEILERLRNHDHPDAPKLARAAAIIGTDEAIEALVVAAARDPADVECTKSCTTWHEIAQRRHRLA